MLTIGVIGDFDRTNRTHTAIAESLDHTGTSCIARWLPTENVNEADLAGFNGIWCSPGSPYRSIEGALLAIRYARERGVPFIGTCAGFQHAILEYARNVLMIEEAASEEYDPQSSRLFISRLTCSLVGKDMSVRLAPVSRAREAYGTESSTEKYYCNFGVNPDYESALQAGGMHITGYDVSGGARIVELPAHSFFVATLFVPQTRSMPTTPHPLIEAFVRACA